MALRGTGGLDSKTVQSYTAPASSPGPILGYSPISAPPPPPAVYDGGGGGGGGGIAQPMAAPVRMSLDDYIKSNMLYTNELNEGKRREDDFNAETLRMTQETEADQGLQRKDLRRYLDDAGVANAESMAGRGLLRSGLTFQNQDRINTEGVQRENAIASLLTDLVNQRGSGFTALQGQNRSGLNTAIANLTTQFNNNQSLGY